MTITARCLHIACSPSDRLCLFCFRQTLQRAIEAEPARGRFVVYTGHSLGGGLASILGVHFGYDVVAFSAPGIAIAAQKFGVDRNRISKFVTVVVAHADFVPAVDQHRGLLQSLECEEKFPGRCHMIASVICELYNGVTDQTPSQRYYHLNALCASYR